MRHHIPTFFLCWAPFPVPTRIIGTTFHRWGHVLVQCLGFGRGAAPFPAGKDSHDFGRVSLGKRQNIAGTNRTRRFAHGCAPDANLSGRHHPGSDAARFEKPRMPQPFIQADRLPGGVGQPFLNPANAAANGLSGSIAFSRFGLAANVCGLVLPAWGLPLPFGLPLPRGRSFCGRSV